MCSLLGRHITGIYADLYCVHIHSLAATSCQQHVFTAAQNMNRIRVSLYPDMAAMRSIAASENKDVREYCLQHAVPLLHKGLSNFSKQELDLFVFLKVALKVLSMSHLIQCNFVSLLLNPNTKEWIPERLITLVAANGRKRLSLVLESQKEWISTETQEVREDKNTRCQVDCFSVVSHPSEKRRKNNNSGIVLFSLSPRTDRIAPVKAGRLFFSPCYESSLRIKCHSRK